jgi:hypothetical protein
MLAAHVSPLSLLGGARSVTRSTRYARAALYNATSFAQARSASGLL